MSRYWELQNILDDLNSQQENIEDEMNEYPLYAMPVNLQKEYDEIAEQIAAIEVELCEMDMVNEDEGDDDEPISFIVIEEDVDYAKRC